MVHAPEANTLHAVGSFLQSRTVCLCGQAASGWQHVMRTCTMSAWLQPSHLQLACPAAAVLFLSCPSGTGCTLTGGVWSQACVFL